MVAEYLVERDKAAIKHRNAGPELYGSLPTVNVYGGARRASSLATGCFFWEATRNPESTQDHNKYQ
jgi:hypothetical protein